GAAGRTQSRRGSSRLESDPRRKTPLVMRTVNPDVMRPRFDTERVEQPMVIVRIAVLFVRRDIDLVGPLDEVEALDRKRHLRVAGQLLGLHLLETGVGAVTAYAVRVVEADAEDEVVHRLLRPYFHPDGDG